MLRIQITRFKLFNHCKKLESKARQNSYAKTTRKVFFLFFSL